MRWYGPCSRGVHNKSQQKTFPSPYLSTAIGSRREVSPSSLHTSRRLSCTQARPGSRSPRHQDLSARLLLMRVIGGQELAVGWAQVGAWSDCTQPP
jgi:hypothetical protein